MKIIHDVPPKLTNHDWCAIDVELFGAEKSQLHKPTTGRFACVTFCFNNNDVYIVTDEKLVQQSLTNVGEAVWIFHNAKFDITHLKRWAIIPYRAKLWDTMLIERILYGGYYDLFSLKDLARRHLDIEMKKETRDKFEKADEMTEETIWYSCYDSLVTRQVCMKQRVLAKGNPFKVWKEVDRDALWAFIEMQPIAVDKEAWIEFAKENQAKAEELEKELSFNPRSWQQVQKVLKAKGFKRLPSTGKDVLEEYIEKYPKTEAVPIAKQVLEYRKCNKRASTYGENWAEEHIQNGFVLASYNVIGAKTGRTSCDNPNFTNIPARDKDAYKFRRCFIAPVGMKMIVVDMGQQEARINAFLSQDQKLIELFNQTDKDIFVEMAREMYSIKIDKHDPRRKTIKNMIYGMSYGMSPEGFSARYDCTVEEAEENFSTFFRTFRQFKAYMDQQKRKTDYVETIIGRRVHLNPYSNQCERTAINSPAQGTAADQVKKALGRIYLKWKGKFPQYLFGFVLFVYDELVFCVPDEVAEDVAEFVSQEMIRVAEEQCPGVPFIAEPKIGFNWAIKS